MLGLSRTPIRQALPALEKDGLLTPVGKRGYAVREFTNAEILTALEIRGALEGLAARLAAKRGISPEIQDRFRECLELGDAILKDRSDDAASDFAYGEMNAEFHQILLEAANEPLISEMVERCAMVPFVSPGTIAFSDSPNVVALSDLMYAHRQHHYIVEAIEKREASRAEMLTREHATTQQHSMNL